MAGGGGGLWHSQRVQSYASACCIQYVMVCKLQPPTSQLTLFQSGCPSEEASDHHAASGDSQHPAVVHRTGGHLCHIAALLGIRLHDISRDDAVCTSFNVLYVKCLSLVISIACHAFLKHEQSMAQFFMLYYPICYLCRIGL